MEKRLAYAGRQVYIKSFSLLWKNAWLTQEDKAVRRTLECRRGCEKMGISFFHSPFSYNMK